MFPDSYAFEPNRWIVDKTEPNSDPIQKLLNKVKQARDAFGAL